MVNNKGFTLIELLVTITILGIVTVIAIPVMSGLTSDYSERKLKLHLSAIESAAKLYVDSKGIDVFAYDPAGCADIYYTKVSNEKLIEPIDFSKFKGINENKIFVRVRKNGNRYTYTVCKAIGTGDCQADNCSSCKANTPCVINVSGG